MMGHIIEWYYSAIAGIRILEPGFKKIRLSPWMPESIHSFECTYETPFGELKILGRREENGPVFAFSVPDGIKVVP